MEKLVLGTHHISLRANGQAAYEKTVAFYKDLLGLTLVRQWVAPDRTGCMLSTGDCILEITDNGTLSGPVLGSINHFALLTKDVDALTELVRGAGYEIFIEPKDAQLPSDPPYPVRVAFCRGPIGEEIEFYAER